MATAKTPASKIESERWFVRITAEESFLRQKCVELGQWNSTITLHAVFHKGGKGENPHVHFIHTYDKPIQKQSYDLKIKKLFGVVGTAYSTKPWDGAFNGAGSYLYHEEDDENPAPVFASKGIEQIHIEAMKQYAAEWRAIVVEKKAKASMKLVERALEYFENGDKVTLEQIWYYFWALIRNGECYNPGEHHLRKYAIEVLAKHGSDRAWDGFVADSFLRAFPEPFRRN